MRAAKYLAMVMALCAAMPSFAQVPYERLVKSDAEPQNWLMYGGNYGSIDITAQLQTPVFLGTQCSGAGCPGSTHYTPTRSRNPIRQGT